MSNNCPHCQGTRWRRNALCHHCEHTPQQAANTVLERARTGLMTPTAAEAALDEYENRPSCFEARPPNLDLERMQAKVLGQFAKLGAVA